MNLTEVLLQSHTQLRQIGNHLLTCDDNHHQSIFFQQLCQQFLVHEHAEEYIAYRLMTDHLVKDDNFNEQSLDYAVNEHHYFEDFVENIALMPADFTERTHLIHELIQKLDSHMQHEEAYIFPKLTQQLDAEQNQAMIDIFFDKCREFDKKYAPTID